MPTMDGRWLLAAAMVGVVGLGLVSFARRSQAGGSSLPPAKQAALAAEERLLAAARARPAASKPAAPEAPAVAQAEAQRVWGLLPPDVGPVPFSSQRYRVTNKWLGKVRGQFTAVYAAVTPLPMAEPVQGVLIVWQPDTGRAPEVYHLAGGAAPQLVAGNGETVVLTVGGVSSTFDLVGRRFVGQ